MQLCKKIVSILWLSLAAWAMLGAQDLSKQRAFSQTKLLEFREWLAQNGLEGLFQADSIAFRSDKVTLFLRPAFNGQHVCDSMQCAWNELERGSRQQNGQFFHDRLLRKWAFLNDVPEAQAEVIVRCHEPAHFYARIYGDKGKIPIEGRSIRSAAQIAIRLPAQAFGGSTTGNAPNTILVRGKKVGAVCTEAKRFFVTWYRNKGTPVLYSALIDTSFSFEDEFTVEITKLSYEICPDGFFEYHQIHIMGIQKGDDVEITWEFQGKYGSGILFPPRKNDYKDLELHYKSELETYQNTLFRRLSNYLSRK